LSIRTNIVGTHWLCVARYRWMCSSAVRASNWRAITTVPPSEWMNMENRSGAAW
jgi:hypothetical protein